MVGKSIISFVEKNLFLNGEWKLAEGFTEKAGIFSGKIWNRWGKFWEEHILMGREGDSDAVRVRYRLVPWNFHGSDVILEHVAQKQMVVPSRVFLQLFFGLVIN